MKKLYYNYQKVTGFNSAHYLNNSLLNGSQNPLMPSAMNSFKTKNIIGKTDFPHLMFLLSKEITPEEIKQFKRTNNMRSQIFGLIVVNLILIIEVLLVISLIFKKIYLDKLKELYDIVFNASKLREAVLETSLLMTSGVFRLDYLEPMTTDSITLTDELVKNQLF